MLRHNILMCREHKFSSFYVIFAKKVDTAQISRYNQYIKQRRLKLMEFRAPFGLSDRNTEVKESFYYDYLPEDIRSKFKFEDMMASKSILDNKSTFGEALEKSGFRGDKKFRIYPEKYMYMFETHIEQGPILEDAGNDIGVVDCVLGMFNYRLKFYGQTTHAGTFPMPKRKDAFLAADILRFLLYTCIKNKGSREMNNSNLNPASSLSKTEIRRSGQRRQ